MNLTEQQIANYHTEGFLIIHDCLNHNEIELLYKELPKTIDRESPRIVLEGNGAVRSVFAPHFVNETYLNLSRLERFVNPSEQLIGNNLYLHQFKINTKKALKSDWWEWHQDFPYWHFDDGIKKPDLVNVMIYLQDTDSSSGALMLIPKSHQIGIAKFADKIGQAVNSPDEGTDQLGNTDYLSSLSSDIKFTVDHDLLKNLASQNGIFTVSGRKGTVVFFHSNLFHASNVNLTPFDRDAILITYNSISNLPEGVQHPRPDYLSGKDYDPITDLKSSLF